MVISADKQSFALSGHKKHRVQSPRGLDGMLTKVSLDGTRLWSTATTSTPYDGSAGSSAFIVLNECWGLKPVSDGYVVGCGTGIENCPEDELSGQVLADCQAGTPDTRPGAVTRPAAVWQSFIWKTDLDGNVEWGRTDQWRAAGEPAVGTSG